MDPKFDFITNILNVSNTDVEKLNVRTDSDMPWTGRSRGVFISAAENKLSFK